jgi:endonuclease/exonuclease/phosphatase family metal-dependent hydrolase
MKLSLFDKIIICLNIILATGLLLSYAVPFSDPRDARFLALVGLTFLFLVLFNLIFIVYWLFLRRVFWIISSVTILLGLGIIKRSVQPRLPFNQSITSLQNKIRVVTYNVHSFKPQNQEYTLPYAKKIFQLADSLYPNVICMQEFSFDFYNKSQIFLHFNKTCKSDQFYFRSYESTPWDSTGVAIFSKFKIIKKGYISSDKDTTETQAIFVDVQYKNKIIRIYCIHLQSVHLEMEDHSYLKNLEAKAEITIPRLKTIVDKLNLAFVKRSYQASLIKQHLDSCPYPYIVAGDFNDTPNSFAVNEISKGLKNAFVEKGCGFGFTYYGDFPNVQIDYILSTQNFDIESYDVINKKLSDHYPVVSNLSLQH